MWNSIRQTALTLVALAGLASGVACPTHIVVRGGPADAADHAAAGHEHHRPSHSNAPVPENADSCCVPRLANTPSFRSVDAIPHALQTVFTVVEPGTLVRSHPIQPTDKPPGRHPPPGQTTVLLI